MRPFLEFDLSGLGLRLRGTPVGIARALAEHWSRFATAIEGEPFLDVEVEVAGDPLISAGAMAAGMRSALGPASARFEIEEGAVEVRADGTASASLAPGPEGRQHWGLINLLCAAVAWRLPSRRGVALHAAGIVLDDRALLLLGPEGAGKTTWARLAEEAGASVLSDDIVLLDMGVGRLEAISSPFRADDFAPMAPGRWPLAALLLPRHDAAARLEPASRLAVAGRLVASLLYVGEAFGTDPRVVAIVEQLAGAVPGWTLGFSREGSFVELLRGIVSAG